LPDLPTQPPVLERQSVPPPRAGERLDFFALSAFAAIASRKGAAKLAKRGLLLVNGQPGEPHCRLRPGDEVALLADLRPVVPILDLPLAVRHEDDWLAVVEKPAGIPVSGNYARTVERALPGNLRPSNLPDALPSPRPVHRLDSPTQGLLLVAKNARALVELGRQFADRTIAKHYRAICQGRLEGEGRIDFPLEDRPASTRYRAVLHTPSPHIGWTTTLDLFPLTGRTHQLRQHLAAIGHPILGDGQYTEGTVLRGKGLYLAAVGLAFHHPEDQTERSIQIPEPAKFDSLRKRDLRRWRTIRENASQTPAKP